MSIGPAAAWADSRSVIRPRPAPSRGATVTRLLGRAVSTGVHRGWELAVRPRATSLGSVPASVDALTPAWLTHALCRDIPGAEVTAFEIIGGSRATTSRANLRVAYNGAGRAAGLPEAVFVKLTSTYRQRLMLGLIRVLEAEPRFYEAIRPLLDIETPEGYHGAFDPRSWRSAVVIEDIAASRGATFCHATDYVDRPGVESLVTTLARCHGALWEHPAVVGPQAGWLKLPLDHFHNTAAFLDMRRRCEVGVERAGEEVPGEVRSRLGRIWSAFVRSMRRCSEGQLTLLHGDAHVGNTYRLPDGRMGITDWQVCMRGCWAFDYANAVSTSLTVEDRRAWERELLELYLEELRAAGGGELSFEEAWDAYRHCLLYPFHCFTCVLGRNVIQPETQPADLCRVIIGRVATAIADLEVANG